MSWNCSASGNEILASSKGFSSYLAILKEDNGGIIVLEIRSLVIASLLTMLFSGVACGGNLLLGGINQDKPVCVEPCSSTANYDYKKIAADLDAYYFPMYYSDEATNIKEVNKAARGEATEQNGLKKLEGLKKKDGTNHYETIVAYSGGTSTAVAALADNAKYGLTCDTLILVSPMAAKTRKNSGLTTGLAAATTLKYDFEKAIEDILVSGAVKNIVVIQSEDDQLLAGDLYQFRFSNDMFSNKEINSKITIHDVKLDLPITPNGDENAESTTPIGYTGEQAHKDIFFEYAKDHLKLGNDGRVYYSPNGVDSNSPLVQAPELGTPQKTQQKPAESSESSQESTDTPESSQESTDTPESSQESTDTSPDVESVLEEIDRQFQDENSDLVTDLINNLN